MTPPRTREAKPNTSLGSSMMSGKPSHSDELDRLTWLCERGGDRLSVIGAVIPVPQAVDPAPASPIQKGVMASRNGYHAKTWPGLHRFPAFGRTSLPAT